MLRTLIMLGIFAVLSVLGTLWVAHSFAVTGSGDLFNTDLIQPYMIVRDAFLHPESLLQWQYSPANYVFPDLFISGMLYILGVPWLWLPIAYAGVSFAAYAVLFGVVAEVVRPGTAIAAALVAALVLAAYLGFAAANLSKTGSLLAVYLVSSYIHTGAILAGLVAVSLALVCLSNATHQRAFRWLLVVAVLTSYSDLLFVLWFIAPIAFLWFLVARARADKALRREAIVLVAASVLANLLDKLTRSAGSLERDFQKTLENLWQGFVVGPIAGDWVMAIITISTLLMALASLPALLQLLRGKQLSKARMAVLLITGVQWASILAPALAGQIVSIVQLRYAMPIFLLPVLWGLLIAAEWVGPRARNIIAGTVGVALIGGSAATVSASAAGAQVLLQPLPVVACTVDLGRTSGYSDYWLSKLVTFFSDYKTTVVPLLADGSLHRPSINLRWLDVTADGQHAFAPDFVIMERLNPDAIEAQFGRPQSVVPCGSIEVWLYDATLPIVRPYAPSD